MTDASRLRDPQAASDLLMYRLNKLMAVSGSLVIRLCEGGYGITRREWGLLMWLARHPDLPPAELARLLGLGTGPAPHAPSRRCKTKAHHPRTPARRQTPGAPAAHPEGAGGVRGGVPQVKQLNQALLRGLPTEAVDVLDQALILLQANADALQAENAHLPRTYRMRGGRRRAGDQAWVTRGACSTSFRWGRVLKVCSISRLGEMENSVTALLRMRMFSAIVTSGAVPSTSPTAVEMGPPLLTSSTF